MITFSNLGRYGRLGNQMFQIASTIGISMENKIDFIFPEWICSYSKKNYNTYLKNKIYTGIIKIDKIYAEKSFSFQKILFHNKQENIDLFGYFQSEKYFKNHKEIIFDIFKPNNNIESIIEYEYSKILKNSCSVHIRRGDYLNLQHIHPILPKDYYEKSIEIIKKNRGIDTNFIFFSDDIDWCKKNFFIDNSYFISLNDDFFELMLMSNCVDNIISNSSFSWWGSWLNKNVDKIVISPKNWFGENVKNDTTDLYCDNWLKI